MELIQLLAVALPEALRGMHVIPQEVEISDEGLKFLAAGLAMAVGAIAPPIGIGMLVGKAMEALGRNPEAQSAIQGNMIIGIALCEAVAIYALIVAVMIGFVF